MPQSGRLGIGYRWSANNVLGKHRRPDGLGVVPQTRIFKGTDLSHPACPNLRSNLASRHGATVPAGPDWLHEIKHHGYRLIVQRDGEPCDCGRATGTTGPVGSR